jgi:hypothetical protein
VKIVYRSNGLIVVHFLSFQLVVCVLLGPKSAPDAEKLKAIDQEYHYLIETHQNAKAEQVQLLYHFKAKKANIVS